MKSLMNLYQVTNYFDDGTDVLPGYEAIVRAENEEEALQIVFEDDENEERRQIWKTRDTKVLMIGWATGELEKGVLSWN